MWCTGHTSWSDRISGHVGLGATEVAFELEPEPKEVMRTRMKDVVPNVVDSAMALGLKAKGEWAVEWVNKRERQAREIAVGQEATIIGSRSQVGELQGHF